MTKNTLKMFGGILAVVGAVVTLASSVISEQTRNQVIKEEVEKAVSETQKLNEYEQIDTIVVDNEEKS